MFSPGELPGEDHGLGPGYTCPLEVQLARACPDHDYGGNFWGPVGKAASAVGSALTSDCVQGIGISVGLGVAVGASIYSGAIFLQSAGAAGASLTSGAATVGGVAAYSLGPVPSDTILMAADVGGFAWSKLQNADTI